MRSLDRTTLLGDAGVDLQASFRIRKSPYKIPRMQRLTNNHSVWILNGLKEDGLLRRIFVDLAQTAILRVV